MRQITLTPEQEKFLERLLNTGKYNTFQEAIARVFQLLEKETHLLYKTDIKRYITTFYCLLPASTEAVGGYSSTGIDGQADRIS
ncbi:hypothetical protein [Okeania sp. SIO1I7]|uniref:hypothetical protein n=1 Tax=Okeania sp. SIO1I7 TaxID=2607772 RepID=UPI0013F765F1|nr:hypothetical protein [Okeania sp. SIO1I7]NET25468.1 hypothetical protein [Okeania sp. SIO1I7]